MSDALKQIWEKVDQMIGPQRMETEAEHIARDMREGRFPKRSDPIQVPVAGPAIARHLAPGDDLVELATAALQGVTGGPWRVDGQPWNQIVWSGAENRVCFMAHSNGLDDDRDIATARFIAFTRQWVPEAAARIAALTATVAEQDALDAAWCERVAAITAEAATLRARLARMEGALEKAANRLDWAAGIIESDKARNQVGEWADEARAALTDGGSNG